MSIVLGRGAKPVKFRELGAGEVFVYAGEITDTPCLWRMKTDKDKPNNLIDLSDGSLGWVDGSTLVTPLTLVVGAINK